MAWWAICADTPASLWPLGGAGGSSGRDLMYGTVRGADRLYFSHGAGLETEFYRGWGAKSVTLPLKTLTGPGINITMIRHFKEAEELFCQR